MNRPALALLALSLTVPLLAPRAALARKARHAATHKKAHAGKARHAVAERAVATYTRAGMPNIQARAAVVIDMQKGEELYAKNADEVRSIASISKLMAMMVVLDHHLDLDKTTTILDDDRKLSVRGARSRLPVGMTFTNKDLLHAALMASDNRAVPALGRAVGLEPAQLAEAMTQKAQSLGLPHTSFGDPTGLDDRNHSTPREVARFLQAAIHYPLISEITRKATYLARAVGGKRSYAVEYTNTDVWARSKRFTVLGGKTGYTDLAGYCLAIAAHLEERGDVAMVFLGEQGKMTRFADFARAAQWIAEKKPQAATTAIAANTPASALIPSVMPAPEVPATTLSAPSSGTSAVAGPSASSPSATLVAPSAPSGPEAAAVGASHAASGQ